MKKLDLGQSITILANVGVIAGIIFLAVELRQNNELLEAEVSYSKYNVDYERRRRMIENSGGISDISVKNQQGEELTATETYRLGIYLNDLLFNFEWQYEEMRAGRLDESDLDLRIWRQLFSATPGLEELLESTEDTRAPGFVEFIDDNVLNQ